METKSSNPKSKSTSLFLFTASHVNVSGFVFHKEEKIITRELDVKLEAGQHEISAC